MENKFTDNEIMKALECCCVSECDECPYDEQTACVEILKEGTLALINRQKAMIDGLIAGQETLQKALCDKNAEIERLEDKLKDKSAEIRALIASIDRLMKVNKQEVIEHLKKINFNAFPKEILNAIKSEARKEFAERLKEKPTTAIIGQGKYSYEIITEQSIDNLVKEMEGKDGLD